MPASKRRSRGISAFVSIIGLLVVALIASLALRSCSSDDDTTRKHTPSVEKTTNKPIGAEGLKPTDVTVTGQKVPTTIKAVEVPAFSDLKLVSGLTAPMEITPSGPLQAPLELHFRLYGDTKHTDSVLVATRQTRDGEEDYIKARVHNGYATVQVKHFSFFQVFVPKTTSITPSLKRVVEDLQANPNDANPDAKKPECTPSREKAARANDYTITPSSKKTLYWCFEKIGDKRVLKIVNRMYYPITVRHPGMTVIDRGITTPELTQLTKLLEGKNQTTMLSGDKLELRINELQQGASVRLTTDVDGAAQGVYKLDTVLQANIMLGSKFGAVIKLKPATRLYYEVIDALLAKPACASAVVKADTLGILDSCIDWSIIGPKLGSNISKVLSATAVVDTVRNYFRSEWQIAAHYGDSQYNIAIQRGKRLTFRNLTIPLQPGWTQGQLWDNREQDATGIKTGTCPRDEYDTLWCSGVHVFGPNGGKVGHPKTPYTPEGAWDPFTDVKPCPMYLDRSRAGYVIGDFAGYPLLHEGKAKLGNRSVPYHEWKIGCGASDASDGSNPVKYFVQKVWYDPQSKVFIVDEWNTPGLSEALANATWN